MITRTTQFEVTRDGVELLIDVTGCIDPYVAGKSYGDPYTCYPPEGGYAEMESATLYGKPFYLTEAEQRAAEQQLYEEWEGT